MEFEKYAEYIEKKLNEKGINIETQDYVIKYVYMNQKLFGTFLKIDTIIERILDNLNYNIDTKDKPSKQLAMVLISKGYWSRYDKKITINPIYKIRSFLFQKEKQKHDSTVMHEIDHCATTKYIEITEEEKEQCIQTFLERKKYKKTKYETIARNMINRYYDKKNGVLAISGILDDRLILKEGINLRKLNEGITAFKQEMYDNFLGNKAYTRYTIEKSVAKFIGDVIGKEKLVSMHFNNDYEGIRTAFREETGKEMNDLVEQLNRKPIIMTMLFGKVYSKVFSKQMKNYLEDFKIKNGQKGDTAFVPNINMDYTAIGKIIEVTSQKQLMERDIEQR